MLRQSTKQPLIGTWNAVETLLNNSQRNKPGY
jgi:hypothetical protein